MLFDDGGDYEEEATDYKEALVIEGENLALLKTPFTSGSAYESFVDKWGLEYINDGSKMMTEKDGQTNGWMSNAVNSVNEETYVGIDLADEYSINRVVLYPRQNGNYFPIDFDIEISLDYLNWTVVIEIREDKDIVEARVYDFDLVEARYVRVVSKKLRKVYVDSFKGYIMQISELEIYNMGD